MNLKAKILVSTGLIACTFWATSFADFAVIGNPDLPINRLSENQVKRIFLGQSPGISDNEKLQAYNQPDQSNVYREFYRVIYNWSSSQVASYWSSYVFQGLGDTLPSVSDDSNAIAVVEGTPGAISYIDTSALPLARGNVKVLYQQHQRIAHKHGYKPDVRTKPKRLKKSTHRVAQTHPKKSLHTTQAELKSKKSVKPIHAKKTSSAPLVHQKAMKVSEQAQKEVTDINATLHSQKPPAVAKIEQVTRSFWPVFSGGFSFQSNANVPLVRQQIAWYIQNKAKLLESLKQSESYLSFVYKKAKAQDVPVEFALYPIAIAGLENVPQGDRVGLWQLSRKAAVQIGLQVDANKDLRSDVPAATDAVLKQLVSLHRHFSDWLITFAALKSGVTPVQKALDNSSGKRFWSLKLDSETKLAVARLVALTEIIKYPGYYGVALPAGDAATHVSASSVSSDQIAHPRVIKTPSDHLLPSKRFDTLASSAQSMNLKSILGQIYTKP